VVGRWVDIARLWVVAEDAGVSVRILVDEALFMFRPLLSETALFLLLSFPLDLCLVNCQQVIVVHPSITRLLVCFFPYIS